MTQGLDAAAARRWASAALGALAEAREEIDALNVFPVPDGDTGTNMYLTLESAVAAAAALAPQASLGELADALARGALLGARGNSGVIGAQLLRGWADAFAGRRHADPQAVVEALRRADEQAWRAVNDPVEGTILSVSRAAAQAARDALGQLPGPRPVAEDGADAELVLVVQAAAEAARYALELTPRQLPELARAGVVDAGGRGLVVLLDALSDVVAGATRPGPARHRRIAPLPVVERGDCGVRSGGGPSYEVMFLFDADDAAMTLLRPRLAALGDSLVAVGGAGLWNVHVHVHDPGAAVEAAIELGRPHRLRITHFAERPAATVQAQTGLVACAAGPGLAELFQSAGAVVVPSGPGRRASTANLLQAVQRTGAARVALLPNDADTLAVARAAAAVAHEQEGVHVTVLPTRAQVQGLAAAAVHDPGRDFEQDVVSMTAAAGGTRDGAVTVAARDGLTSAGECRVGDVLGVLGGDFVVVGTDAQQVAVQVVERLLSGGGELVTLVVGAGGHEDLARRVRRAVIAHHPAVEVSVLAGGQPRYPLLIGVE